MPGWDGQHALLSGPRLVVRLATLPSAKHRFTTDSNAGKLTCTGSTFVQILWMSAEVLQQMMEHSIDAGSVSSSTMLMRQDHASEALTCARTRGEGGSLDTVEHLVVHTTKPHSSPAAVRMHT